MKIKLSKKYKKMYKSFRNLLIYLIPERITFEFNNKGLKEIDIK